MLGHAFYTLSTIYPQAKQLNKGKGRQFLTLGDTKENVFIVGKYDAFIKKQGYTEFYNQFNTEMGFKADTPGDDYLNSIFEIPKLQLDTRKRRIALFSLFNILDIENYLIYYNIKGTVDSYERFVGLMNVLSKVATGEVLITGRFVEDSNWITFYDMFEDFLKKNNISLDDVYQQVLDIQVYGLEKVMDKDPDLVNFLVESGFIDMVGQLDIFSEKYFIYLNRLTDNTVSRIVKKKGNFYYVDINVSKIRPMKVKPGARAKAEMLSNYILRTARQS